MFSVCSIIRNFKKYGFFFFKIFFCGSYFINEKKINYSKKIENNKKISIYGFGPYGEKTFLNFFLQNEIVNIYDMKFYLKPLCIKSPDDLCADVDFFDYIVVTVMNSDIRESVIEFLKTKGVPAEKIVYANYVNTY